MMRRVPFLFAFLSACMPTGSNGSLPQPEQHGLVRALHIARGAPPLNVTFDDGKPMASAVRFGGITKSVDMPIGDHDFDVVLDNTAVAKTDQLALASNQTWSVFMWGDTTEMHASLLDDGPGLHGVRVIHALPHRQSLAVTLRTSTGVELIATTQDQTALVINAVPPAPPASVRVVHLSPDAPAVDVTAGGAVLASDLAFENATSFASVSSGTVDLDIALATAPSSPLLSVTNLNLAPSSFTTAVAFGRASDLRALAINEDRTPPAAGDIRVRAIHTAVGIGTVDVYAVTADGNVELYDNLAFGAVGDVLEIPAGAYTIGLDLDKDATPDLVFTLPHLAAGTIANLFAVTDAQGKASIAVER
jgi:hypothetical protein